MTFSLLKAKNAVIIFLCAISVLLFATTRMQAQNENSPCFDSILLNEENYVVVSGKAPAFAAVEVIDGARKLGEATADDYGRFVITLDKMLGSGLYQLVLRAMEKDGKSVTSLQTVTLIILGGRAEEMTAFMRDPSGTHRFITDQPSILRKNDNSKAYFYVKKITYRKNKLEIIGRAPDYMQIMASLGNTRFGTSRANRTNAFELTHFVSLFSGDHIIRLDLINSAGETVESIGVPFRVGQQKPVTIQFYRNDKPVRITIVQKGQTLSSIAKRVYGKTRFEEQIYAANHHAIKNKNHIIEGQELILPIIKGVEQSD